MSKQRIDYRPNVGYTYDYQTDGKSVSEQNIVFGPRRNTQPLDTESIPEIEDNILYLDSMIKALPIDLSMALREVYDPIREIFYDTLIDKIVDPNPHKPDIIIQPNKNPGSNPGDSGNNKPGDDKPKPNPGDEEYEGVVHPIILHPIKDNNGGKDDNDDKNKNIHPIILYPIDFKNSNKDPDSGSDDNDKNKTIHPIVLQPIKDGDESNPGDGKGDDNIKAPYPIILHPIPGIDGDDNDDTSVDPTPDPGYTPDDEPIDDDPEEGDPGLWEPPEYDIKYLYPDINESVDREFVYLLTKLVKHYTDRLKDILNNYYFNIIRYNLGQSEENIKFIFNKMKLTSNDILNHSKHLLDSSVKNENVAALRTEFFKNTFSIRDTAIHVRSFYVSHELRKRYTNIKYSKGKSIANSMSDSVLTKLNMQYELQYRKNFENLFRYLESSLKITEDILRLHIQDGLNKSTIIKKGGIK